MAMEDYNKLKVTQLKDLLKERGIPSTGLTRKQQIVDKLEEEDAKAGGGDAPAVEAAGEVPEAVEDAQQQQDPSEAQGEEFAATEEPLAPVTEEPPVDAPDAPVDNDEATAAVEEAMEQTAALGPEEIPIEPPSQDAAAPPPEASLEPPTVDELLVTPQRSPKAEESDSKKRKRRSPTPPLKESSVSKKLKSAEEDPVHLPEDAATGDAGATQEDAVVQDAPAPLNGHAKDEDMPDATVQPLSTSDDVVEMPVTTAEEAEIKDDMRKEAMEDLKHERSPNKDRYKGLLSPQTSRTQAPDKPPDADEMELSVAPAIHLATRALYIRELVRPLQPQQLKDHLLHLAKSPSAIEDFHLDALKSHALVLFTSVAAAARVRAGIHDRVFPDEPTRKPLWADFVPEEKVQEWIEHEMNNGGGRASTAKKWEVVYSTDASGEATATLQEGAPTMGAPGRQASFGGAGATIGAGMPGAPSAPRGARAPATSPPRQPQSESFDILDQKFPFTTAKPKLYYKPVEKDMAERRLDALDKETARDYDARVRGGGGGRDQMRRYTFEDEDRIVDGGVDFGSNPGGARGGYRGRGGYGGFRGDSYRGR